MGMFKLETEILVKRVLAPQAQFQQSQAVWMRWTTQEKSFTKDMSYDYTDTSKK